jgi:isocitrate dehydrogenase
MSSRGTIETRAVTNDFARLMQDAREVKCSEFGSAVIQAM